MFKSTFIFALAKAKWTRHAHSKCLQQLCNQLYNFLVTYTTSDVQASFTQAASIYGRPAANSSTVTLHGLHRVCFFTAAEEHYFSLAFPQLTSSFILVCPKPYQLKLKHLLRQTHTVGRAAMSCVSAGLLCLTLTDLKWLLQLICH